MFRLLFCTLLFVPVFVFGQKNTFLYSDVIDMPNIGKEELYKRAKAWFGRVCTDSNKALQLDSEEMGMIEGKTSFLFDMPYCAGGNVYYTVRIFLKESKYKYELTDFTHKAFQNDCSIGIITPQDDMPEGAKPIKIPESATVVIWKKLHEKLGTHALSTIASLHYAMDRPVPQKQNNW